MRLFIAIDFPQDVKQLLNSLMRGIKGAKWVPQENLHLTLYFIGVLESSLLGTLKTVLQQISAPCFPLTLKGIGHFQTKKKLRALWVGVESPNEMLFSLQQNIENTLRPLDLGVEKRKFKPHVTLARFKNHTPVDQQVQFISTHNLFCTTFVVKNFTLFESRLKSPNSLYYPLQLYPLQ